MASLNSRTAVFHPLRLRAVEQADLSDLTSIESLGAIEPTSLAMMRRWYDRSRRVQHKRNRRLWLVMRLATDMNGDVLGHVVLLGENTTADLARLVVHPDYRRQAIGSRLLADAIDEARDRHSLAHVDWIVHECEAATIGFATSFGFKPRPSGPIRRGWFSGTYAGTYRIYDGYHFELPVKVATDGEG